MMPDIRMLFAVTRRRAVHLQPPRASASTPSVIDPSLATSFRIGGADEDAIALLEPRLLAPSRRSRRCRWWSRDRMIFDVAFPGGDAARGAGTPCPRRGHVDVRSRGRSRLALHPQRELAALVLAGDEAERELGVATGKRVLSSAPTAALERRGQVWRAAAHALCLRLSRRVGPTRRTRFPSGHPPVALRFISGKYQGGEFPLRMEREF